MTQGHFKDLVLQSENTVLGKFGLKKLCPKVNRFLSESKMTTTTDPLAAKQMPIWFFALCEGNMLQFHKQNIFII